MGLLGTLGSLNVLLSADTAQFAGAMEKAAYTAERNLGKIGLKAKVSLAAITALFLANAKHALTYADSIGDMADRIGLSSEQMSILAHAATMSDVEVASLETTLRKMYVSAYKGSTALDVLGVNVKDATGKFKSGYEIFVDVADAFSKMPDGVGKTNAAIEIFGKTGSDIVPLLNSGKKGIAAFAAEARDLGVLINEKSAQDADAFDKSMKKVGAAATGAGVRSVGVLSRLGQMISDLGKPALPISSAAMYVQFQQKIIENTNKASAASDKATEADKKRQESIIEQTAAFEQAVEAAEKKKKMEEDGIKLTEKLRTAQEIYNDDIKNYNELLSAGAVSQETYSRAVKKANDILADSKQKTNSLSDAASDLGFMFQSAFEDAIIEGKKFGDIMASLLQDIERIILRNMVVKPLAEALSSAASSFFSTAPATTSAHGNIFSGGNLIPFASGGLITRPSLFPMANGGVGLAGEAGDEAIMPLFRGSNGDLGVKSAGRGGVEINVYAPEGSKVSSNSESTGDMEKINIMIDEAVAGSVKNPGSRTHRALKNSFGLKQTLTTR